MIGKIKNLVFDVLPIAMAIITGTFVLIVLGGAF
jgi:hypothetical protein